MIDEVILFVTCFILLFGLICYYIGIHKYLHEEQGKNM